MDSAIGTRFINSLTTKRSRHTYDMLARSSRSESLAAFNKLELGKLNTKNLESRRIILQNFTSCDPEELSVKQGQKVTFIFREGDWAFVVTDDNKDGFVPFVYCAKLGVSPSSAPAIMKDKFEYPSAVIRPSSKTVPANGDTHFNDALMLEKSAVVRPSSNTVSAIKHTHIIDKVILEKSSVVKPSSNTVPANSITHIDKVIPEKSDSFSSKKGYCSSESGSEWYSPPESVASTPRSDLDIVQAFFRSSPYEKLPKFLEVMGNYPTTTGHISPECPSEQSRDNGQGQECVAEPTEDNIDDKENSNNERAIHVSPFEVCTVLYNYEGSGPDDISAEAGDRVRVMDGSDLFWYLVQKEDRSEGYIPKYYLQSTGPGSISPRSTTSSAITSYSHSDNESTPRGMNVSPTITQDVQDDPVVVPCNTQFTKVRVSDNTVPVRGTELNTEDRWTPVKPPRTNKPKCASPPTENTAEQLLNLELDDDSDDYTVVVDVESDNSDNLGESLSESVRLELIHRELEKLAPMTQRDSMHNSMSSCGDSVFENNVHCQLDQLRPTSAPPYKVYKYEREKADYYEEYFYEGPEPNVKITDKEDVINVSEILEIRDALRKVKEEERQAKLKHTSHQHGAIPSRLKQYMLTLPSTVIGNDGSKYGLNNSKDSKGTRRYYVSQVEENEDVLYARPMKVKPQQDESNIYVGNLKKNIKDENGNVMRNSSGKIQVNLKKRDWSFGFPRKTKHESDNGTQELNDLNKPDKENFGNASDTSACFKNEDMETLLEKSGGLLDQSKDLLTKKTRYRTSNSQQNKGNKDRNIEFTDATEKCNHYLTNLILNGVNTTTVSSETLNEHTDDENVSSDDQNRTTPKNKSQVDENENIKLSYGITIDEVEQKDKKDESNLCNDVRGITEFIVQYDYAPTEDMAIAMAIPVVQGEVLHIGLDHQEDTEWYWAYSPRLKTNGYVPKIYVRIPMVTII